MDWLETLCLRPRVGTLIVVASAAFGWWQQSFAAGIFLAAVLMQECQWTMVLLHLLFTELDARAAHVDTEKDY
jgi:hypothetical protein